MMHMREKSFLAPMSLLMQILVYINVPSKTLVRNAIMDHHDNGCACQTGLLFVCLLPFLVPLSKQFSQFTHVLCSDLKSRIFTDAAHEFSVIFMPVLVTEILNNPFFHTRDSSLLFFDNFTQKLHLIVRYDSDYIICFTYCTNHCAI